MGHGMPSTRKTVKKASMPVEGGGKVHPPGTSKQPKSGKIKMPMTNGGQMC